MLGRLRGGIEIHWPDLRIGLAPNSPHLAGPHLPQIVTIRRGSCLGTAPAVFVSRQRRGGAAERKKQAPPRPAPHHSCPGTSAVFRSPPTALDPASSRGPHAFFFGQHCLYDNRLFHVPSCNVFSWLYEYISLGFVAHAVLFSGSLRHAVLYEYSPPVMKKRMSAKSIPTDADRVGQSPSRPPDRRKPPSRREDDANPCRRSDATA